MSDVSARRVVSLWEGSVGAGVVDRVAEILW